MQRKHVEKKDVKTACCCQKEHSYLKPSLHTFSDDDQLLNPKKKTQA